jgi:long-subunit acyl-CoA synthetase (AMP-forming)
MIFGAAPMKDSTRQFFLQLNISLFNGYGMSETSGAITVSDKFLWTKFSDDYLKEAGTPL